MHSETAITTISGFFFKANTIGQWSSRTLSFRCWPAELPTTATPTAMVTPQFLSDIVGVLSGLGLLTPNQGITAEQSATLVQQAVGQIHGSLLGNQQAPAAAAASSQNAPTEEEPVVKKMKIDADI